MCRLCCSRALWTARQGTPLVSASVVRCSAVQSMARGGPYITVNPNTPHKTRGPAPTNQNTTDKAPEPKRGQTNKKGGGGGKTAKDQRNWVTPKKQTTKFIIGQRTESPTRGTKTRKERQKDREKPKDSESTLDQGWQDQGERAAQRRGRTEHKHRDTNTEDGGREPGGSRGQKERGTRGPDRVHTCLSGRPRGDLEHQR